MRVDLALIGYGNVGRRFADLLEERRERLEREYDLTPRILGIATARHGCVWRDSGLDGATVRAALAHATGPAHERADPLDAFEIIRRLGASDADLRVVVETTTLDIRAGRPAIDHVRAGFAAGCHVVTANKGPAAFAYAALEREARDRSVSFLFEGAVMDGVPVFNLVRETLPVVDVLGFRGVINSTTNHIITAMEQGERFAAALERMQAAGIAEADPSLDVDGWDAAAKAAALANVWMRAGMTPHEVSREGIDESCGEQARAAIARGTRLRLVASAARRTGGRVEARVARTEVPGGDLLAGLSGQANALVITTDLLGDIAICQMDGSLTQTAYALLSDLVRIRQRHRALPAGAARRTPGSPAHQ